MSKAPEKCPLCGSVNWIKIDTDRKGFSAGKAIIGGIFSFGIGAIAGFSGKKKSTYACKNCKFQHEYNGG